MLPADAMTNVATAQADATARSEVLDCVVVGAGPAGLSAALYLRRFHRRVRLVDAGGGRARRITCSKNVAGFPEGISGPELLKRMEQHLRQVGGEVVEGTVCGLGSTGDGLFAVEVGPDTWLARTVMLCTGVKDRLPAIPGAAAVEAADLMRYCPICDGYEHTGKRIGVLGNSVHSVREAAFLQCFSRDVCFIGVDEPSEVVRGALASARVSSLSSLPVRLGVEPGGEVVVRTQDGSDPRFDVLYAALGVNPCAGLAAGLKAHMDETGNIVTDAHGLTSVDGLYAAGDVVRALDQIGVAVGQAAIAAVAIHNRLAELAFRTKV